MTPNRRRFLQLASSGAGALLLKAYADAAAAGPNDSGRNRHTMSAAQRRHEEFMAVAIEAAEQGMALGQPPFGSVVVYEDRIVGQAHASVAMDIDPTAHAEVMAIRDASENSGTPMLQGHTIYASSEPCPMCCGAILNAGIRALVIASRRSTFLSLVGLDSRLDKYSPEALAEATNTPLTVIRGVLEEEADAVLRAFPHWDRPLPPS